MNLLLILLAEVKCQLDNHGVILIPSYGKQTGQNEYLVHVKGRISTPATSSDLVNSIDATNLVRVPEFNSSFQNLVVRQDFLETGSLSNITTELKFYDVSNQQKISVTSSLNGTFEGFGTIKVENSSQTQVFYSLGNLTVKNFVLLAKDEGFGVISDIDDTIKKTEILSTVRSLRNTFLDPYIPTDGLPKYYQQLSRTLNPTFHYLSASPIQLIPSLQPFLEKQYPLGELSSATLSLSNGISGLLQFADIMSFKVDEGRKIMNFFPNKKFILIGDSTQLDPEVYAKLYSLYPGQTQCIMIRLVTGVSQDKEKIQNSYDRFNTTFSAIPKAKWKLFTNSTDLPLPEKLKNELKDLVAIKSEMIAYHLVERIGRSEFVLEDARQAAIQKIDLQVEYLSKFCDLLESKLEKSLEFSIEIMELSLEKKRRIWEVLKQIDANL